jgi:hypothetical protein
MSTIIRYFSNVYSKNFASFVSYHVHLALSISLLAVGHRLRGNANMLVANMPFVRVPKSFAGPAFGAKVLSSRMSRISPVPLWPFGV